MTGRTRGDGPAPARLLALRLQGFKSFAERTIVEFGPGISAVVGPNGSGKSNLADALRWALGEQGRALRSRRSEDVIFAGSERRAALGMADVTLVLDNADALLPVDYGVLEIGRRLYRSGENDYLLNKQRIRLRDLVDLLDAAHLADNAFLFIGQGMVDQALALRPEERRPLFEEVAGVRRHERRRRKAEEQLVESETNLARVEDILAELRPQARRLAAQAEQQASRTSAGEELAAALLVTGHARWHEVASKAAGASDRLVAARGAVDDALAALQEGERVASAITAELAARADVEIERRAAHEAARDALIDRRLRQARLAGDRDAIARERRRLEEERAVAETDLRVRRRELAEPTPQRDGDLEARLAALERVLAQALDELGALREKDAARGDELAALRRAEASRRVEVEAARRRVVDGERRLGEEESQARESARRHEELEARARDAAAALESASLAERSAAEARAAARGALDDLEGRLAAASERSTGAAARAAALRGRLEALRAGLAEEETRGIARAARRRGGRRLDEDLQVDPDLRAAVEAALGPAARGYLVGLGAVPELATERGMLIVDRPEDAAGPGTREMPEQLGGPLKAAGGGMLAPAVRRDPSGAARRLLATAVWVPDLAAALEIQSCLPTGWIAVTRDGSVVAASATVSLGRTDGLLERREDVERLAVEVDVATADAGSAAGASARLVTEAARARDGFDEARAIESAARSARRQAEEVDRAAGRALEAIAREAAWHQAQVARLEQEVTRARDAVAALEPSTSDRGRPADAPDDRSERARAIAAWETRIVELREQRDRVATELAEGDRARREAEARRARSDAAVALDEERIARAAREAVAIGERERELEQEAESLGTELAAAVAREEHARRLLDELRAADAVDRERLASAETRAAGARDRLRVAEDRLRSVEVADLEARLGLDAIREQLLVELAGLGELGLRSLGVGELEEDESAALETALAARCLEWAAVVPPGDVPSPGRLAYLRRRYHDLGAANPFAVDEYAALKVRLETLEAQHVDLRAAIGRTRELIEELNALIADQFRTTFRALETAFDAQFQQLFGGGFARLSLTDPADLSATGVEIVARPPGKKAQALAMLSGGERALTAVALLFAMLEVRPVPFCVLDEVDAALDEANVGRFSEALRGLAHQTQFIVITHNRGTIEIADALYGVTVGDDSVSRVISLRLEEARELAQPRGAQSADLLAG